MVLIPKRIRVGLAVTWLTAGALSSLVAIGQEATRTSGRPLAYVAEVDALIHPISAEFIGQNDRPGG